MSTKFKLIEQFAKPSMVGVLSYFGSMAMLPQQSVNVMGYSMNSHLFYGLLGVGGSFVSELAHNWLLPYLPGNDKFAQTESMLLAPAVNAGIFALATKMFIPPLSAFDPRLDLVRPALLGAGAEIGGQYVYEAVLMPYLLK